MKKELPKSLLIGLVAVAAIVIVGLLASNMMPTDSSKVKPDDYKFTPQQMQKLKQIQNGTQPQTQ